MKILVISDTHNIISDTVNLIKQLNPDYVLHLGDMCDDCENLENTFPDKLIISVRGNNDYYDKKYPYERCFELGGKKIFMCHGHMYNVKATLSRLMYKAQELEADIILYGHTHIAYLEEIDGKIIMNPGSIRTYGIIEINDGKAEARIENVF